MAYTKPLDLPRRMAPTDALFWYAESALPIFRPIIAGLYLLDRTPDPEQMEAAYDRALAVVPRLRQRVVEAPLHLGPPEWVFDPHFDREYHLRHFSLPEPGSLRQLLDLAATLLATPLDRERPLWEAYWIDGLEGGRAAHLFKTHHSLVDGVGSLAILNSLTRAEPKGAARRTHRAPPAAGESDPGTASRLARLALDNARGSLRLARSAAAAPLRALADPVGSAERVVRVARGLRGVVWDLAAPAVRDPLVCSTSGLSRRLDVMDVPLERLRKIKAPLGVSINDVILTALAGSLGAYHQERRVRVESLNCLVPMNLRGPDERDTLGNRVGMFNIVLPVSERRPKRRLERIVAQTRAAKRDKRGAAAPLLVEALGFLPGAAFGWLARHSLGRVNVACTNVPGVPERRYMGGATVEALYPFASVVEGTPLVMALLSYAGTMHIGIDTDPEAIPDPHAIARLFEAGLEEMESVAARAASPPAARRRGKPRASRAGSQTEVDLG